MGTVLFALILFVLLAIYYISSVGLGLRNRQAQNIHDINIYNGYEDPYVKNLIKTFVKNHPYCTSTKELDKLSRKRLRKFVEASDRLLESIRKHLDQEIIK